MCPCGHSEPRQSFRITHNTDTWSLLSILVLSGGGEGTPGLGACTGGFHVELEAGPGLEGTALN